MLQSGRNLEICINLYLRHLRNLDLENLLNKKIYQPKRIQEIAHIQKSLKRSKQTILALKLDSSVSLMTSAKEGQPPSNEPEE